MKPILLLLVAIGLSAPARGADCFDEMRLAPYRPPVAREVLVAVDETTLVPPHLAADLNRTLREAVRPGDRVSLLAFSAVSRDRYVRETFQVTVEPALSDAVRRTLPVRRIRPLERCIELRHERANRAVREQTAAMLERASAGIQRSEIVFSLREIGARLQASPVKEKVLVLVSDMLENSAFSIFYAHRRLALIDPVQEMEKIRAKSLTAPLAGVRVYVFGGGLAAMDEAYRAPPNLLALEHFWSEYVKASGGQLAAFGKPALLVPIL